MLNQPSEPQQIAPGVYEGLSPAKGEVRRFIKLPEDLKPGEMTAAVEAAFGEDTSVGDPWRATIHLSHDLTEKNEQIGDGTYVRFLATADVDLLKARAQAVRDRIEKVRAETENG